MASVVMCHSTDITAQEVKSLIGSSGHAPLAAAESKQTEEDTASSISAETLASRKAGIYIYFILLLQQQIVGRD